MRPHTCRTRSRAWASAHHIGTSRVHWSHSAPPPRVRTHPPSSDGRTVWFHHSRWGAPSILSQPHPPHPPICVHVPLPQQGRSWVYATTHPPYCPCTTGSFKSRNPYKPIYFETADYGVVKGSPPTSKEWNEVWAETSESLASPNLGWKRYRFFHFS